MRPFTFVLYALVTTLIGCSSTADDAAGTSADVEASCGQYYDAIGHQPAGCLPLGIAPSSAYKATDKPLFVKQCLLDVAAPGTSWSPSFLSTCAADMEKLHACANVVPTCQAKAGSLADGAGCSHGTQCAGSRCKVGTPISGRPTFCGTCATAAAEGGECKAADECAKSLFCLAGKCAKSPEPLAEGAKCAQTDPSVAASSSLPSLPCAAGLFCNSLIFVTGPTGPALGVPTCAKLRAKGEACTFTECQSGLACSEGACFDPADARDEGVDCQRAGDCKSGYCDRSAKKCKAVVVVTAGARCGAGLRCADGLACQGTDAESSTCVAHLPAGAACASGGAPCATNTVCRNGTCQLNDPASCQ